MILESLDSCDVTSERTRSRAHARFFWIGDEITYLNSFGIVDYF